MLIVFFVACFAVDAERANVAASNVASSSVAARTDMCWADGLDAFCWEARHREHDQRMGPFAMIQKATNLRHFVSADQPISTQYSDALSIDVQNVQEALSTMYTDLRHSRGSRLMHMRARLLKNGTVYVYSPGAIPTNDSAALVAEELAGVSLEEIPNGTGTIPSNASGPLFGEESEFALTKVAENGSASLPPETASERAFVRTNVTDADEEFNNASFNSSTGIDSDGSSDEAESKRMKRNMMIGSASVVLPILCLITAREMFGKSEEEKSGNPDDDADDYWGAQGRVGVA